jgi:CheY-like chemotaxis protein
LVKPIKQSDLFDRIVTALGRAVRAEAAPAALSPPPGESGSRPLRVLLAEDNAVNQRLVVHLLGKRGHSVTVTADGREALAAFQRQRFDLVLMDVQMPEMGGFEVTTAIRRLEAGTGSRVPILALTAHAMKGDRERCLEAGMDGYIPKPLRAAQLFEAMAAVVPGWAEVAPEAPAEPGPDEVFNQAEALERVEGDHDMLRQLAEVFLDSCPGQLAGLQDAIARRDAPEVQRAAHALKGAASTLGARAAAAAALRLEAIGRAGDFDGAEAAYTALEEAVDRLRAALAALGRQPVA